MSKGSEINSQSFQIPDVSQIKIKRNIQHEPDYIPSGGTRGRDALSMVFFNTGALWLVGFGAGGSFGTIEGFRNAANTSLRVRINSMINTMSKRGVRLGTSLGILGFFYTTSIGIADLLQIEQRLNFTPATPIISGAITSLLFNMPNIRSPQTGALAVVGGASLSCVVWYGGSYIYNVMLRGSFGGRRR